MIDFDLHGFAGIRLINASERDAATVTRQLGPIQASLAREPDVVIRFVDRLPLSSPVRYLGVDDAAFTDDAFLVLRSKHKARAMVQIPFEQIGEQCEIVCERGLPAVPLLIPILNLTVLGKGVLPLHASAFTYNGIGVLTTGWSKGGKTEALLAFMARGATYIGDEWVYLNGDSRKLYGIPEPIRLWDWHLNELPQYRARVGRGDRARLRALRMLVSMEQAAPDGARSAFAPARALNRITPLLKRQLYVQMPPKRLFGSGAAALSGPFDRLFFVVSDDSSSIHVQNADPREIAQRIAFSLQHERLDFLAYYLKFRFAFPGRANLLIERAAELEQELLARSLAGKPAYAVSHPYPVSIPALFDAMRPMVEG